MPELFSNEAKTTLSETLSAGGTSLKVTSATGFPTSGNFRIRIQNEILLVTAVSGTTWTVSRAVEGVAGTTAAAEHSGGVEVAHIVTALSIFGAARSVTGYVNVKDPVYGAKGDGSTDDTAAIKSAIEALSGSKGMVYFPEGTYIYKAGTGAGAFTATDGMVFKGAGRKATKLKSKSAPGAEARAFQLTEEGSTVEFHDLTFEGPTTFTVGDELCGIAHSGVEKTTVACKSVGFYRMHVGIRGFSGKYQTIMLLDSEVDGGNMGLASGTDKQINCYGVLTSSIGPVITENCVFRRGGSNETGGTNQAHQIYISHDTPVRIVNCRFYEHIAGRYIQFNGNASGTPPVPEMQLVAGCYFGKQQVANIACHSSEKGTVYRDCIWDVEGNIEGNALEIKGPTTLEGNCQFRGGAGNVGIYIGFATSTSLVVSPGVVFKGEPNVMIYSSGNNVDVQINGAIFEGACKTPMLITGGTTSAVRLRNLKVVLGASGNFFDTFSGTIAYVGASDCDFGGSGNRALWFESGSTVTLLQTRDNYFHGNSNAIVKSGTVTTEDSKGNRGYTDVPVSARRIPATFSMPAATEVKAEVIGTFYAPVGANETKKLIGMKYRLASGTKAKFSIKQNGTAVTNFKELEAKSAEELAVSGKEVSVTDLDRFELNIESIEGTPKGLSVTLIFESIG